MKKWLKNNLFLFGGILVSIAGLNYFMDPLWCFGHKHSLQAHQEGFDERQQKLNLIYYHPFKYDGLILGSSRVTLHDPRSFGNVKIFNMAVDGMRPYEFDSYIEYAKKRNGGDFKYIILGLDFMAIEDTDDAYTIATRIAQTETFFYRYQTLIAYDTLNRSIRNFKNSAMGKYKKRFKTYNESHIASSHHASADIVKEKVENYRQSIVNKKIAYRRKEYLKTLETLRQHNPNTRFVVFTTPLPEPLIRTLFDVKENQETFRIWMKDIFTLFGSYYSFYSINPVTQDYTSTFMDAGHYYPEIGECIDQKIFHSPCSIKEHEKFGDLVTSENLDRVIAKTLQEQGLSK